MLFVSGAIALVYEVVWQRQFALVLGSGAPATAAVLAAYFAGLGLGSLIVGRCAKRWSRPLRAYALLELGVGGGALLVAPAISWFEAGYPALFATLAEWPAGFAAVRGAVVFAAVLIPTFCMGGTLPLLGALVDQRRQRLGLTAGWLYVANTAGAGLGALAMPFWLLPRLGLADTTLLCAAANVGLAGAAWWLDARTGPMASPEKAREESAAGAGQKDDATLVLAAISGAVTFALQVWWNRAFAQVHENSMYSFALIVAAVILALALGAQLARIGLKWGVAPRRLLGGAWIAAGLVVVGAPGLFLKLTGGMGYLPGSAGWAGHAGSLAGLAAVLVLPAMALLGVGLPAIMEDAGRGPARDVGRVLGRLLAANIAGSVAGALVAGFVLPRWVGLWSAMIGGGALLVAAGIWQARGVSVKTGYALLAAWAVTWWPIAQLELPRVRLAADGTERLVSLAEGTHGITAVVERAGSRRLKLNNHYALGGTASTGDERMQAHVPLLLHPQPRRVAFLGVGTGITAGGALFHPVEELTAIELVSEAIAAARAHFREANGGVLDDPRTRVVVDDARHVLRGSPEKFDVIVGDLVVPWRLGEGALFTLEQFEAARGALAPGGLFCQWVPLFQLSETEATILMRTFLTVFPRALVWRGDFSPTEPAIALIGGAEGFALEAAVVRRRVAELRSDATNTTLKAPTAVWMNWVGWLEARDLAAEETRINREDRPWIELLGPLAHGGARRDALFTGRRLQAWLDGVHARSRAEIEALLPAEDARATEAGSAFGELVLGLAERDERGVRAAQERMERLLPVETLRQLFR